MRADRLVAALLFLQTKGRVTAAELAQELEISERTARRDLEALSMSGVPVYSQAGRGGGWSLVGGARTDLSGLTADEARTLFLVAGPSSAATPEVKVALRKLVQALPETFRADAEAAASAVYIDATTWDGSERPPPEHLDVLQRAVVAGVQVRLGYADRERAVSERLVHPLGLVVKGGTWYLIAGTDAGQRTFRVDRVRSVELTDDPTVRPADFDLDAEWRRIMVTIDEKRSTHTVIAAAQEDILWLLRDIFGTRLTVGERVDGYDPPRRHVEMRGTETFVIGAQLAGFGQRIEVLDPPDVRDHLARIGDELRAVYRP
jgi:predicted DNA-binding transcriptional regulator YafY